MDLQGVDDIHSCDNLKVSVLSEYEDWIWSPQRVSYIILKFSYKQTQTANHFHQNQNQKQNQQTTSTKTKTKIKS